MHKEAIEFLCDSGGAGPVPDSAGCGLCQRRVSAPPGHLSRAGWQEPL